MCEWHRLQQPLPSHRRPVPTVTLPGGARHGGSDCLVGAVLGPGDALGWASSDMFQGSARNADGQRGENNGCAAKGTCGLTYTAYGLGGGWQLCFA